MLLKRTFTLKNKIEFKAKEKIISKSTKKEKKEKEKEENFPPKKLSNYINTDNKIKYILKNKSALKEYEIFLNRFKKKKKQITFGSINKNYQYQNKMSIFKDNPRLIISSYKANFTGNSDDKKVKFQNNILGVDEGLIILPKINIELEQEQNKLVESEKFFKIENIKKRNDKEDKNKDKLTNIYSNTELKKEDNSNKINNNKENYKNSNNGRNNSSEKKMKSLDIYKKKNKNIKESYLERGEEVVNKYSTERNIKKSIESYNNKGNKTLDNFHHFNYEIRRLNKWDFNNISKKKKKGARRNSLNTILTEIKQSQRLSLLTEIKHNKEQFKIISRNKHLKDFVNKINEDQNAIFMQNIKVFKKNFNFSVFDEKESQNDNKDKYINNTERKKTDTYNDIIKKKVKLEDNLSHEVGLCAEDVYIYKNKIENEKKKKLKLGNDLYKLKKREEKKIEEHNDNIKRLDLLLQQLENAIMQKNLDNKNKNGSESKNNEVTNKLSKGQNIYRSTNTNMGNLKSKTISIINSVELSKIRTLTNNKENKITKSTKFVKFNTKNSIISEQSNSSNDNDNDSNNELMESKDEELMIKNNLLAQKTDLDNEHKKEMLRIKEEKDEIKNELNKINNNIIMFSKQLSKAKNYLNEHINSLSDYYYQILKKGIDVRRNGLSWVVVKLMELNSFIDYNHFPNFLDIHQINYLMKIGAKIYEVKELIKLFQLLKQKEKAIKEEHYDEDRKKEKEEKQSKFNEIKRLNGDKIGNNYVEYLEEIQHKYDNAVNFNIDEEIEEKNIIKTSKYLKDIIMYDWERNMELYYIPGSLAEYFSKDKKFREYFDDAYYLKEEINKRQNDIKKDKEKELNYYRNKYKILYFEEEKDGNKNNNLKKKFLIEEKNENDNLNIRQMIFAALFGNSTPM